MIRRADALARLNPTFSSLILEVYLQNKNLYTICSIRITTLVMYTINIHGQLHCYDRLLCSRDSRPNRSISCCSFIHWSFVGRSETGLSRIALWDSCRYGGPQVHTEFQKVTPNSNNSHRIQITHTEFK